MKLLPDPVCKRIANLWALANDPGGSAHECAVAREMLRKLQAELRLSDFMLVYLLEREQKSRGEFDPIEIMIYLFEEARIKLLPEQEIAVALWDTHTFVYHHYFHTPRLLLRSYATGCGKTALMSLLKQTTSNSLKLGNVTAAVIYNYLRNNPGSTFLIDEGENNPALWSGERLLLNIFNNGHRRDDDPIARVIHGKTVFYPCFAPLALAYVNEKRELPSQSLNRSIPIGMTENPEGRDEFDPEHSLCSEFRAGMRVFAERFERPLGVSFPEGFTGRVLDNWRPLIEIGTALGYSNTACMAALAVQRAVENIVSNLLSDIRRVFNILNVDRLWTPELLDGLYQLKDSRWNTFFGLDGTEDPHKLIPTELYRLLRRKGIWSRTVWKRIQGKRVDNVGFLLAQFEQAWRDISGTTAPQSSNITYLTSRVRGVPDPDDNTGTGE